MADDGFIGLVGPLFHRLAGTTHEYALVAQPKHRNIRGVVQGGLLMTFADRTMGLAAGHHVRPNGVVTVQMDTQFADSAEIGETLFSRPQLVRATRSLVFMTTEVKAGARCVILASAVFKIVKRKGE
jgi:acyl-coenzyme A thioesterase PaaI-like protein